MAAPNASFHPSQPNERPQMIYETPDHISQQPDSKNPGLQNHIEPISAVGEIPAHAQQQDQTGLPGYHPSIVEHGPAPAQVTPLKQLGQTEAWIACPYCRYRTKTKVQKEDTNMTMICGAVLCLICICATCLPCLCGWFQDYHHTCSNCGNKVATVKEDGSVMVHEPQDQVRETWYPDAPPKPEAAQIQPPQAAQVKSG